MRPDVFQSSLGRTLTSVANLTVRPAVGPDGSGMTYGLVLTTAAGAETWWQVAARRAPGDDEGPPVTGPPPAPLLAPELPAAGRVEVTDLEALLAAAVTRMEVRDQVAALSRYSTRERPPAVRYGLTVDMHDGSAVYVQLHWTLPAGQSPSKGTRYRLRPTV